MAIASRSVLGVGWEVDHVSLCPTGEALEVCVLGKATRLVGHGRRSAGRGRRAPRRYSPIRASVISSIKTRDFTWALFMGVRSLDATDDMSL